MREDRPRQITSVTTLTEMGENCEYAQRARRAGHLVLFPELSICGYRRAIWWSGFVILRNRETLGQIAEQTRNSRRLRCGDAGESGTAKAALNSARS